MEYVIYIVLKLLNETVQQDIISIIIKVNATVFFLNGE